MKVLKYARGLIVLGVMMMAVAVAPANWTARAGLDVWNVPKLQEEIAANERFSREMDVESEIITHRIQVKDTLVKELIAGRATLAVVADQFQTLNNDDPEIKFQLQKHYRLKDERIVSALNVLAFAETYLEGESNPALKPAVMRRLDDEFDRLFPHFETMND
ncbi:hypothetical protein BH11PLA2_BH11PLA2_10980 [soil metagenome]